MSTVGLPISVTFPTVLTVGQPITITAIDENGNPVTPDGLTFSSDNSSVVVTVDPSDPFTFLLNGVKGSPVTANVTYTDSSGNTVVATATTFDAPPPATITLIATAGTPV